MGRIEKIVMIKNAVETLGYFSEQLAVEFEHEGLQTYFVDYDNLAETVEELSKFAKKGKTAFLTFNFIGMSGEEVFIKENEKTLWEVYAMPCENILVDHPIYYHSQLEKLEKNEKQSMKVFCIDRQHVSYIRRFYPKVWVGFLPLAGNVVLGGADIFTYEQELVPFEKRKYDLVFTANYVPFNDLYRKIKTMDEEYVSFYRGMLEDLIENPAKGVDEVMENHMTAELGTLSDGEKREAMSGMLILDLCVRAYFREKIIQELAQADLKIHVVGADWNLLSCKKPQNIIRNNSQVSSITCVEAVRNARISLNIMPWFKDGAHDRVFTAMLQKTVALTDESLFLSETFRGGEELFFYSLAQKEKLPSIVYDILSHQQKAAQIADCGYVRAYGEHTWRQRAKVLMQELLDTLI